MWRHALERGLAGLIAKHLLDGRVDSVFSRIEQSGALTPERIAKLRAEVEANLHKAKVEGEPYADVVPAAMREVLARVPDLREALTGIGKTAAEAARNAAEVAKAEIHKAAAEVEAKRAQTAQPEAAAGEFIDGEAKPMKPGRQTTKGKKA